MKKLLLFSSPVILTVEVMAFNGLLLLLSMDSDIAFFCGIAGLSLFGFLNYLFIKFLIGKFQTKTHQDFMKNLLILVASTIIFSSCTRIDAANEGILVNQYGSGKGQGVTTTSGTVFYNPFTQDVYEYPVFIHTVDYDPFTVNAKDGSIFTVDPVLSYRIIRGSSANIFRKYRKDIKDLEEGVLRNYVKDAFKNVFNTFTTDNILSHRQQFDNEVTKLLSIELNKEGFEIDQLTFGMNYPESITAAIDAKNKAVQDAQQAMNKLIKDSIDARSMLIKAQAEKEANELKQQSLSPLLIQQQFIERWDGRTPLYGNVPTFFKSVQ